MMPSGSEPADGRLDRERAFHDDLAATLDPLAMPPQQLGPLEAAMFEAAGVVPGAKVLDLGCGSGDLMIHLLAVGADVTGVDLSPGMLALAEQRVSAFGGGRTAELRVASAEGLDLDSDAYDVVVGRFILHHLEIGRAAPQIARVLRPGGRAVFAENSARNPILMAARRHVAGRLGVPRLGTEDEHPLSERDVAALAPHFADVRLTFPVFEFFRIFDRQVLRFRSARASGVLRAMDRAAGRIPRLRPYSFRVLVTATAR
jgi:SAM-dependent methyltransferase